MKKQVLLLIMMLLPFIAKSQYVIMYIEVEPTSDLKNIPVTLYMDNNVDIIGLQATFALPAGLTKEKYNYDEDEETYFLMTRRTTKNHQRNSKNMFKASAPNDLFFTCFSDNGSKIKDNSGAIGTFWFDGSSLADGTYSVKMYDAYAFSDANSRYDASGMHTPDQSADYNPFECEFQFIIANRAVIGGNIKCKLTYMIDGKEYKSYMIDYNSVLAPENAPIKKGMTFSGWDNIPENMPAYNVTIRGSYSWSKKTQDNVIYQVTDTLNNYVSVIGNEEVNGEVIIHSSVDIDGYSYTVNNIANNAFYGCSGLTSVTIPNSVTSIGSSAFYGCSGLTSVTIPNSVTTIGNSAFSGCSTLTSVMFLCPKVGSWLKGMKSIREVVLGEGVTSIESSAFYDCTGLTSVTFGNNLTSIGEWAFCNCTGLISVTIPNSVTSIGEGTFYGCSNLHLKSLAINPPTLEGIINATSIEVPVGSTCNYAMAENWNLIETIYSVQNNVLRYPVPLYVNGESIVSVNGVSELGVEVEEGQAVKIAKINDLASYGLVMQYNSNITDILLDNGNYTFKASSHHIENKIETIAYPTSVVHVSESGTLLNQIGIQNIDNVYSLKVSGNLNGTDILAIRKLTNLKFLDMEDANIVDGGASYYQDYVTSNNAIGDYFFKEKDNLIRIRLPKTITDIKSHAFDGCKNMSTITIPNSVTSIGSYAFYGCSGLTSVTILCPTVGSWFEGMTSIKEVILGEGVTSINNAFYGCSSLTSISIPNSVTSIGGAAFAGCSGLTSVHIFNLEAWCGISFSSNPLSYAHHLYLNGEEIKDLVIPNSVTSIGSLAFNGCSSLTSVTIPNSVKSIGDYAFSDCTGLTSVTIPNSVTSIGGAAFSGCSNLTSVKIPNSVTSIGESAFSGCTGLTSVTFPNSITSIGDDAFKGCTGLTSLTIEDGTETLRFHTSSTPSPFSDCPLESLYLGRNIDYSYKTGGSSTYYYSPFKGNNILSTLTIGNFVTSIGSSAFYGCSGLTSVIIPNSVTSIDQSAFQGCSGLTSVTIGNGVTSIGSSAFYGCTNLTSVTSLNTTPPEIQNNTFSQETYTTATLKVPVGCQTIYWLHPYWENFTNVEEVASTITVTAKNCSREYGEENPVFGYDVLGGELEGTPEIICEATKNSPVGTYPIVIRNGSVTNDDVAYVDGTLTITKAPLTITAKSYTINRNDALPVYEATYSGFKNGETNSVLTKQPTLSCTATNSETAGEYAITPSGAAATNYTISYVAGKLTINAGASQTITMATSSGSPRTMKGYSSPYGLDFTNVDGVKAYTAVGFSKDHVVYLSRVKIVPPNTGVILRTETPGITVDVPITDDDVYLANLLLPAVSNVIVNPTEVLDGVEYRNLMVGQLNGTTTMGFVEFSSPVTRSNNCYLHIPSSFYNSTATARALGGLEVEFDEGEFTDIREIEEKKTIGDDKVYDLQGRKVNAPSKGIVIKNGKLVFIK